MRLFSSLRLVVAPPACEPGQDTSATSSASSPFSSGSATAFGSAFARSHGSRLLTLRLLFLRRSAVPFFEIADFSEGFHGSCLDLVSFPVPVLTLSRLSASFAWLTALSPDRQSHLPVLIHSSNHLPLVTAIRSGPKLLPSYLTRFGTASNRSSSLSPFFACTDGARTPPEELVNPASAPEPCDPA